MSTNLKGFNWINHIFLLFWLLTLSACASTPFNGYIVDSETKEPVEGVVVNVEFIQRKLILDEGAYYVDSAEALTDKEGYYTVPNRSWSFNLLKMWETETYFTIFKVGYKPIEALGWDLSNLNHSSHYAWKIENGKTYINLRKYKNLDEMIKDRLNGGGNYESFYSPSRGEPEKQKLIGAEINKERSLLTPYTYQYKKGHQQ